MKAFAESREVHLKFRSIPKDSHLSQSDILLAEFLLNMHHKREISSKWNCNKVE